MSYKEYIVRVYKDRTEWYNKNGELHRDDGLPAIEYNDGGKYYFINGRRHREDGPAYIACNGCKSWCLNGIQYSEQDWKAELAKRNNSCSGKIVEIDGKKYELKELK